MTYANFALERRCAKLIRKKKKKIALNGTLLNWKPKLHVYLFSTKLLLAAILDYRKSLLIAFLAISDQYATFNFLNFVLQNGRRRPF